MSKSSRWWRFVAMMGCAILLAITVVAMERSDRDKDSSTGQQAVAPQGDSSAVFSLEHLTPLQRAVTQEAATERPFTGKYYRHREPGQYQCVVCHAPLFSSKAKFDSPCGWPSFDEVMASEAIEKIPDYSHGMIRVEVRCAKCHAHLGHVFPDGPTPTGQRYCINSAALHFHPSAQ